MVEVDESVRTRLQGLTSRQREVLVMIGEGLSSAEIARRLHRTVKTVESHRLALGKKLGVRNRVELALIAHRAGLTKTETFSQETEESLSSDEAVRIALRDNAAAQQALHLIDAAVSHVAGEAFLTTLVRQLVLVFGTKGAFVAQLLDDGVLQTVAAFSSSSGPITKFGFRFKGSPCEPLMRAEVRSFNPCSIGEFDMQHVLQRFDAEAMIVTPLHDSTGQRLGTMALLHDGAIDLSLQQEAILRLLAGRTSAELERLTLAESQKESDDRYQLMASYATEIIATCTPEGQFVFLTPAAHKMFGCPVHQIRGRRLIDDVPEEDRELVEDAIQKARLDPQNVVGPVQYRLSRHDGSVIWVESRFRLESSESDRDEGRLVVTIRDVTGHQEQQQIVQELKRQLHRLQTLANLGTWSFNLNTCEFSCSDEMYRIFGLTPGTKVTEDMLIAHIHPNDRDHVLRLWEEAREGHPYRSVHRLLVDGEVKWVRVLAEPNRNTDGRSRTVYGTTQDVTKIHQANCELREKELLLHKAEELARIGSWEWEVHSDLVTCSAGLCRMLGISSEMMPLPLQTIVEKTVHPDDQAELIHAFENCKERGSQLDVKARILQPDNQEILLHGRGEPFFDECGRVVRVVGVNYQRPMVRPD